MRRAIGRSATLRRRPGPDVRCDQTRRLSRPRKTESGRPLAAPRGPLTSAVLRGFCVFMAIMAGVLVLRGSHLLAPTPEQYVQLAGMGSMLAFLAGFRPRLVARLLTRVASMLGSEPPNEEAPPRMTTGRKRKAARA